MPSSRMSDGASTRSLSISRPGNVFASPSTNWRFPSDRAHPWPNDASQDLPISQRNSAGGSLPCRTTPSPPGSGHGVGHRGELQTRRPRVRFSALRRRHRTACPRAPKRPLAGPTRSGAWIDATQARFGRQMAGFERRISLIFECCRHIGRARTGPLGIVTRNMASRSPGRSRVCWSVKGDGRVKSHILSEWCAS